MSGYVRLESNPNPLSTEHSYMVYELNMKRMEELARLEKEELAQKLACGQQALANLKYRVAADAFVEVLSAVPRHPEALKGLEIARKNLSSTTPAAHAIEQANSSLDRILTEYGDGNHPKGALEGFREKLLSVSEMYRSVREFDLNCPIPKYSQLRRCYDRLERQIRKHTQAELIPVMDERLRDIQGLSLKNERHLHSIISLCRAWDRAYVEGSFLLGSDQMYNKTQIDQILECAELARNRLDHIGLSIVEMIDEAILEVSPKWKMESKNRLNLISYYNVIFMNSPHLRSRWISLTRKGMELFEERIRNHVHRIVQGKYRFLFCFFARAVQRKLRNDPPIFEKDIEAWLNEMSQSETIEDIPERLKMIRFEAQEGEAGATQRFTC